jgi:hypothetical protein
MPFLLLVAVLALSVKQDHAILHAGCDADSTEIAALPAGTPLELRYMMAGQTSTCYKVKATLGTRIVEGYLPAQALEGLTTFERGRRRAEAVTVTQLLESARGSTTANQSGPVHVNFGRGVSRILVQHAEQSIEANEPRKALDLLEPELKVRRDPGLLAMAGVAAWKADQGRRALEFWRESMALAPNPGLQGLYAKVELELANDQSTEKLETANVILRFEDGGIPKETASQMLAVVDAAYLRISGQLGCKAQEKIVTIVQNRAAYVRATSAAAWNGGLYDGRIHLPVYDQAMSEEEEHILAHETTHACLHMLGNWPTWFQEGMAQRFSGEKLSSFTAAKLADMGRERKLPSLTKLGADWTHLADNDAALTYALSYYAVNTMFEVYGDEGVLKLIRNPASLPVVTAELDRRIGLN